MKMLPKPSPTPVLQLEQKSPTYDEFVDFARRNPHGHVRVNDRFMKIELMEYKNGQGLVSHSVRLRGVGNDTSMWMPGRPEKPDQSFAASGIKVRLPSDDLLLKFGLPPNENLTIQEGPITSDVKFNEEIQTLRSNVQKAAAMLLALIQGIR